MASISTDSHLQRRHQSFLMVGFLVRMCPDKGLDTLIEAFIELRPNPCPEARLKMAARRRMPIASLSTIW